MSHYVLTVCMHEPEDGDLEKALGKLLAPYDENKEVESYRRYEDESTPEEFWAYQSLKRSAEEVANDDRSSVKPYKPNEYGWSSAYDTERTEPQQWADIQKEAEDFAGMSIPPTWPEVIEYANARWFPEGLNEGNVSEFLQYEEETDRCYTISTYNPKSKWDWYQVGGRWSDYFATRTDLTPEQAQKLIRGSRSWASAPEELSKQNWVDGGPKGLLDFHYMRSLKESEAEDNWNEYHALVDGLPAAHTWTYCRDKMWPKDIQAARSYYNSQSRVQAVREVQKFSSFFGPCLIETYGNDEGAYWTREALVEKASREAVPGFSLLTLEGEWKEPGEMGWFGMSGETDDEKLAFKTEASKYLDNLADDVLVISVDLHI